VAFLGDSSGGGLALASMMRLRDEGSPLPSAAVVLSPWTDLALTGQSLAEYSFSDPMVPVELMPRAVELYLAGADPRSPYASPLYGDPAGLPPTLIHVGSRKGMLGCKPVVDTQHLCAGRIGDAPGKIAKQRWKAEQIGAAVQVQDVSVGKRARPGDTLGSDTAGINCDHLGAARWRRHETPEARHLSADILEPNVRWKPSHEPRQAQADKLGAQTHLLKPAERTRKQKSSSAGGWSFSPTAEACSPLAHNLQH